MHDNVSLVNRFGHGPRGAVCVLLRGREVLMSFDLNFNQSLENVSLPCGLQQRTFGVNFNQSLDNVKLLSDWQKLTFGIAVDIQHEPHA